MPTANIFSDVAFLADVVWPALYLVDRLAAWWSVGIGLLLEYVILNRVLCFSRMRSCVVASIMNGVSSFIGWHFLAWWGWYWAAATDERLGGTFNSQTWFATCVLACLASVLIEWPVVLIAARKPQRGKSVLPSLLLANIASVGIAFVSVLISPPHHLSYMPELVFPFLE